MISGEMISVEEVDRLVPGRGLGESGSGMTTVSCEAAEVECESPLGVESRGWGSVGVGVRELTMTRS